MMKACTALTGRCPPAGRHAPTTLGVSGTWTLTAAGGSNSRGSGYAQVILKARKFTVCPYHPRFCRSLKFYRSLQARPAFHRQEQSSTARISQLRRRLLSWTATPGKNTLLPGHRPPAKSLPLTHAGQPIFPGPVRLRLMSPPSPPPSPRRRTSRQTSWTCHPGQTAAGNAT